MRPTDIERDDRVRLVASFAVAAILYAIVFLVLALLPAARGTGGVTATAADCRSVSLTLARPGLLAQPGRSGPLGLPVLPAANTAENPAAAGSVAGQPVPASTAEMPPIAAGMAASPDVPAITAVSGSQPAASQTGESPAADWTAGSSTGGSSAGDNNAGGSSAGGSASGDGAAESGGDMTVGSGDFTGGMTGRREFLSWLDAALKTGLAYPERAKKRGIEGTVGIYVEVLPDGKACRASVETSSGSSILDRAALTLVESLFPAPVSPEKEFSGTIKIQYILLQDPS